MNNVIVPLSRRTDPAFLSASVVFYRVVERVTSKRAAVQRVLLVSPRGVIYICHMDGRVTHTLHCLDIKWLRVDKPATVTWAAKAPGAAQTMLSFRTDHVSNLPLCGIDYFVKVVHGFNPEIRPNNDEATKAPLELNPPKNIWTQMLQGVRAIRKLDEDYIGYLNSQAMGDGDGPVYGDGAAGRADNGGDDDNEDGENGKGASGDKRKRRNNNNNRDRSGSNNSDDDDIEDNLLLRGGSRAPPPLVMDDDVTPFQRDIAVRAALPQASSSNGQQPKQESQQQQQQQEQLQLQSSNSAQVDALLGNGAARFATIRVTRSTDPSVPAGGTPATAATTTTNGGTLYELEVLQDKFIVTRAAAKKSGGAGAAAATKNLSSFFDAGDDDDLVVLTDITEAAFPNSRDFSLILNNHNNSSNGGAPTTTIVSASWEGVTATAALQKLTNKFLRALREMYPGVRIKTGSAASSELVHLTQSVASLGKKVGDLNRATWGLNNNNSNPSSVNNNSQGRTQFQADQAKALSALLQMICNSRRNDI